MVLKKYIQKVFAEKIILTTLISVVISTFIEIAYQASKCSNTCTAGSVFIESISQGVLFTNDALFFIVSIACIWFILSGVFTSQIQVITLYTGSPFFILKNIIIVLIYICLIYLFPFNHFILSKIQKNNIHHNQGMIKKIWAKDINISNAKSSGEFVLLEDVYKYKIGIKAGAVTVYKVHNGYLESYTKYQDIFMTKNQNNDVIFFTINGQGEDGKIVVHKMSKNILQNVQKKIYTQNNKHTTSFYTNLRTLTTNLLKVHQNNGDAIFAEVLLNNIQIAISLFVATLIPFTQLLSLKTIRDTGINTKVIKAMVFIVISYTVFEVIKLTYSNAPAGYLSSISVTTAVAVSFISRYIKIYH